MFSYIKGKVVEKRPTAVTLDVGGVGYSIKIPLSTYEKLTAEEEMLYIHLALHDDRLELYGFSTPEEKELFELLISVSGVGLKTALGIISSMSIDEFNDAVFSGDVDRICVAKGVGRKTASRVVLELKGKLILKGKPKTPYTEAISALLTLGYRREEASKAVKEASRLLGKNATLEELIKKSLTLPKGSVER